MALSAAAGEWLNSKAAVVISSLAVTIDLIILIVMVMIAAAAAQRTQAAPFHLREIYIGWHSNAILVSSDSS